MKILNKELVKKLFSLDKEIREEILTKLISEGPKYALYCLQSYEWMIDWKISERQSLSFFEVIETSEEMLYTFKRGFLTRFFRIQSEGLDKRDYVLSPVLTREFDILKSISSEQLSEIENILINSQNMRGAVLAIRENISKLRVLSYEELYNLLMEYRFQLANNKGYTTRDLISIKPLEEIKGKFPVLHELYVLCESIKERLSYCYKIDAQNIRTQQLQSDNGDEGPFKMNILQKQYVAEAKLYSDTLLKIAALELKLGIRKEAPKEINITQNHTNIEQEADLRRSIKNKKQLAEATSRALKIIGEKDG